MQHDHEKIRQRAYEMWDRAGRQDGRDHDHWLEAEREIAASAGLGPDGQNEPVPAAAAVNGNGHEIAAKPAASAKLKSTEKPAKVAASGPRKRRGAHAVTQAQ